MVFTKLLRLKGDSYKPTIKISENIEKITNPCFKKAYRVYNEKGIGLFDFLALHDEK